MEVHKLIIDRLFKKRKHIAIRNGIQVYDANRICYLKEYPYGMDFLKFTVKNCLTFTIRNS